MEFSLFILNTVNQFIESDLVRRALTCNDAVEIYKMAFTHESSELPQSDIPHPDNGTYEVYEQIGDSVIKVFMTTYFYRRFPKLWKNNNGVKIVARLVIKYGSKEILSSLSKLYGFDKHIVLNEEINSQQRMTSILEDVFEAFIGATSIIVDCQMNAVGMGNVVCYKILEKIYDQIDISLAYENLFDGKTRLKELVDLFKTKLGSISYSFQKEGSNVRVDIMWNNEQVIGTAADPIKIKAERLAAEMALDVLKEHGFEKKIQKEYLDIIY